MESYISVLVKASEPGNGPHGIDYIFQDGRRYRACTTSAKSWVGLNNRVEGTKSIQSWNLGLHLILL